MRTNWWTTISIAGIAKIFLLFLFLFLFAGTKDSNALDSNASRKEHNPSEGAALKDKNQDMVIFDFNNQDELGQWRPVNDTVMGGISDSTLEMAEAGLLRFSGFVSLENNGGFASLQSRPSQYDLSGFMGIALRVKGDGKRYKFSVKSNAYLDSVRYESAFVAEKDQWKTIAIPFNTLVPTFRGTMLTNQPPLDISKIKSFSLLISDKQEGIFKLEIDWIKAYKTT